jgi:putative acetyltransferase
MHGMTIVIRRAEPADYQAICLVLAGSKAIWGTLQLPFPSAEQWRKRLAEPGEGVFSIVACVETEVIGQLSLHTFPAVRDDWQGKGAGSALMRAAVDLADKWMNLERLELEVYTDNEPAIQLYKKFGFVIEGTLARFAFRDGRYVDAYMMARLR